MPAGSLYSGVKMIPDSKLFRRAMADVTAERVAQPPWDDDENTEGCWVAYIVNYASRWAMCGMFDPERYSFRSCMVKVAALAIAAIEWCDRGDGVFVDSQQSRKVAGSIR